MGGGRVRDTAEYTAVQNMNYCFEGKLASDKGRINLWFYTLHALELNGKETLLSLVNLVLYMCIYVKMQVDKN